MKDIKEFENRIICGDCLEIMGDLPDKSVDLCLTDPPYGIGKKGITGDNMPAEEYKKWMKNILKEIDRITKDGYFIFHNESMLFRLSDIYTDCRLFASCNNFAIMGRGMPFAWSPIVFKIKNNKSWNGKGRNWFISNTADMKNTPKNIGHPSPKPLDVIEYIINQFKSQIIIDPFMGSGSTALACLNTNRRFIGIEINPDYCAIAEKRLANIPNRLDSYANDGR